MARPLRIHYPGGVYHITARGVEKRTIFADARDYRAFLAYLERTIELYGTIMHAFCLMPNHYHLESETAKGNLSEAMQWLNTSYTVYFNRRHGRVGHLFQGRYKALLVEKESYLLELSRYIHLNPVRAGLVPEPESYSWSSYGTYVRTGRQYEWVTTDWTLAQFGKAAAHARREYRQFVEDGLRERAEDPAKQAIGGAVLGGEAFLEWVKGKFLQDRPLNPEQPALRALHKGMSVEDVVAACAVVSGVGRDEIRIKGRHDNQAREMAIYLSRRRCGLNNAALGQQFGGITGSNVTHVCKKFEASLQHDRGLAKRLASAEEKLHAMA
ncbi:MAG: hypothetical protein FJ279_10045 [Planctomycetes bacterium]|nr:hypothetical protein [Planctomycetota bacterium]